MKAYWVDRASGFFGVGEGFSGLQGYGFRNAGRGLQGFLPKQSA